jgi:hypothetical protein
MPNRNPAVSAIPEATDIARKGQKSEISVYGYEYDPAKTHLQSEHGALA